VIEQFAAKISVGKFGATVWARSRKSRIRLQRRLWDGFGVEANPSFAASGTIWLRFSAQIYNSLADYEKLARAILVLRSE
jgi:hypothetical protein